MSPRLLRSTARRPARRLWAGIWLALASLIVFLLAITSQPQVNAGRVYSHRELVLLVQGYDTSQREAPEILRPLVSRLRHKLEAFPSLSYRVVSVRGTGYLYEGDK